MSNKSSKITLKPHFALKICFQEELGYIVVLLESSEVEIWDMYTKRKLFKVNLRHDEDEDHPPSKRET